MEALTVADIQPAQVSFSVRHARLPNALWVRKGFYPAGDAYNAFTRQFSYVAPGSKCFAGIPLTNESGRSMTAERYGGRGAGENGGAGRCGNWGAYQIKGIGPTPLIGAVEENWHTYGGLNAADAIYETIYAQVLSTLLPIGVAEVFGLLLTKSDGAYSDFGIPGQRGWGALLVREVCLRPGHFMPAHAYRSRKALEPRICPDHIRVRDVNTALRAAFPELRSLISRLGAFLQNCAQQFAFARLHRIAHGGISASNLCFDGRWIDLTNTSFCGGQNCGGSPPFFEEALAVVEILTEFLETFGKYNGLDLDSAPLVQYYREQLDAWFRRYLGTLLGIEERWIVENDQYRTLQAQVLAVLKSPGVVTSTWPETLATTDPVLTLQSGLYVSLRRPQFGAELLARTLGKLPGFDAQLAVAAFHAVMETSFGRASTQFSRYWNFVTLCAIAAVKRTLISDFFFKGRLYHHITHIIQSDPFLARELIDDSIAIAGWAFASARDGLSCLYDVKERRVVYDAQAGAFTVTGPGDASFTHLSAESLIALVETWPLGDCVLQDYNFKPKMLTLMRVVLALDVTSQRRGTLW